MTAALAAVVVAGLVSVLASSVVYLISPKAQPRRRDCYRNDACQLHPRCMFVARCSAGRPW